jgi:ribulose-5-phosphate 4-epimerase/fuculose-1-phosphate aldolase
MVKALLPHYHCGRGQHILRLCALESLDVAVFVGRDGHLVYYERPTEMELAQILARGMTLQEMVRHWIFVTEYQYEVLMGKISEHPLSFI